MPAHPAAREVAVAVDTTQSFDRIEEPGFTADGEVETAISIGDDVQARCFLRVDYGRDRVDILFAKQRIAHRGFERPAIQADIVPKRSRIRTGDRRRHHHIAGYAQHRWLLNPGRRASDGRRTPAAP